MIIDSLLDALQDSMKLVPFLLLTYFIMEELEHHTGGKAQQRMRKAGNLGKVMQESVQAAYTCLRSRAAELGIPRDFYKTKDIHVHFC